MLKQIREGNTEGASNIRGDYSNNKAAANLKGAKTIKIPGYEIKASADLHLLIFMTKKQRWYRINAVFTPLKWYSISQWVISSYTVCGKYCFGSP